MSRHTTMTALMAGAALAVALVAVVDGYCAEGPTSPVVDTGQQRCYANGPEIAYPKAGGAYFGQDGQYVGNTPKYKDNRDGTVIDLVTGLIWQKTPDFVKRTQDDAEAYARKLKLAGRDDWRVPTIKELFSLADFRGNMRTRTPYIDTTVFAFEYPKSDQGESGRPGRRNMDAQYCSSTRYLGITMGRDESAFGFNFADGRIKSYPLRARRYVRCVRGKTGYGENRFRDNGDQTVTDASTGLIWQKGDSGKTMDWKQALAYAEGLKLAGRNDWRLPNVKELQTIVDYGKAPDATDPKKRGPAIDDALKLTAPESWFWTNTTHIENAGAYYVCFGQAFSAWRRGGKQINAHGAGAVRSDPKEGDPKDWPNGKGPQGDEIRITNYVRCVRGGAAVLRAEGPPVKATRQGPPAGGERRPQGGRGGRRFVQRLDKNGDGKVSKAEFDGPDRHFDTMDKNSDGFLDASEAPRGPPGGGRRGRPGRGGQRPRAGGAAAVRQVELRSHLRPGVADIAPAAQGRTCRRLARRAGRGACGPMVCAPAVADRMDRDRSPPGVGVVERTLQPLRAACRGRLERPEASAADDSTAAEARAGKRSRDDA